MAFFSSYGKALVAIFLKKHVALSTWADSRVDQLWLSMQVRAQTVHRTANENWLREKSDTALPHVA